jgi:hypothetical protein
MKNQYEEDAFEIVHSKEFLKVGSTLRVRIQFKAADVSSAT